MPLCLNFYTSLFIKRNFSSHMVFNLHTNTSTAFIILWHLTSPSIPICFHIDFCKLENKKEINILHKCNTTYYSQTISGPGSAVKPQVTIESTLSSDRDNLFHHWLDFNPSGVSLMSIYLLIFSQHPCVVL